MADAARLYLVTRPAADAASILGPLSAVLAQGVVACVLLRVTAGDEGSVKKVVRAVAELSARHDVALLVEASPQLATRGGADGVHVRGVGPELDAALASLKPERIVGCGGLTSRDDAMIAGEAEVDYVMFGEPGADGTEPSIDDTLDRVEWWAEIFTVPCVGYASAADEVALLARAGADFVALDGAIWQNADAAAAVKAASLAMTVAAQADG